MRISVNHGGRPESSLGMRRSPARLPAFPEQPLRHLDTLWIQVAGTLCNLECAHCFVASGPGNHRHEAMSRDEVRAHVRAGLALGVREVYFTGGEPFLHPELLAILAETLASGPCTVLTNGTLFTAARVTALAELAGSARYSLELRVSLDAPEPAAHDALRGPGSFARTLEGLRRCAGAGLLPIVTATRWTDEPEGAVAARYRDLLAAHGIARPRIKLLPLFRHGREAGHGRGYEEAERLADLPPGAFDPDRLQCGSCRAVSSRGVFVCPLLVDEPGARMGGRLGEALGPFQLAHGACFTCYVTGMTCANG